MSPHYQLIINRPNDTTSIRQPSIHQPSFGQPNNKASIRQLLIRQLRQLVN